MTDNIPEIFEDALEDFDTDLQSLWDESDDDGVTIPGATADGDVDDDETDDEGEDETTEGDGEESSDADEDDSDEDAEDEESDDETDEEPIDYKALWERAQREVKTMAGRLKATQARAPAPEPQPVAPPPVDPALVEEDQFLAQFREKYSDDVIKAISIIASRQATQHVETTLQSRLTPVEQATQSMIVHTHFAAIESVHPDLEEIDASPVFESWLDNRPEHLRSTYQYIRDRGTPAQVIAMISEFKQDIGVAKKPRTATQPKAAKVAAATAVGRRRGTASVPVKVANNDIAALWDEIDD